MIMGMSMGIEHLCGILGRVATYYDWWGVEIGGGGNLQFLISLRCGSR